MVCFKGIIMAQDPDNLENWTVVLAKGAQTKITVAESLFAEGDEEASKILAEALAQQVLALQNTKKQQLNLELNSQAM